jgi:hypothetical protein
MVFVLFLLTEVEESVECRDGDIVLYLKEGMRYKVVARASNSDSIDSEISEISDILAVSQYRN